MIMQFSNAFVAILTFNIASAAPHDRRQFGSGSLSGGGSGSLSGGSFGGASGGFGGSSGGSFSPGGAGDQEQGPVGQLLGGAGSTVGGVVDGVRQGVIGRDAVVEGQT